MQDRTNQTRKSSESKATPLSEAAVNVCQAQLLILQQSRNLLSRRDAKRLRNIAAGLGSVIAPLERMGRALPGGGR